MSRRVIHPLAVAALALGLTAAAGSAAASPGPGTYTRITTPSGTTSFRFAEGPAGTNHFAVAGTASPDVASVDIDCMYLSPEGEPRAYPFVTGVPVSAGHFTATAVYGILSSGPGCRLRALPTGTSLTGYLGSYAGPVLHTDEVLPAEDADLIRYGYTATFGDGQGYLGLWDAGLCGDQSMGTLPTSDFGNRRAIPSCLLSLPGQNLAQTASPILVDGHGAYLPRAVHDYLKGTLVLPVTQSVLTTHLSIAGNGDVTLTESAPLVRCTGDAFPPTPGSCSSVKAAGVTFTRVTKFFRAGHQSRIRDTLTSTDAKQHSVRLAYLGHFTPTPTGELGFAFPGQGSQFRSVGPAATITGLGTRAGTVFVRSDRRASSDDAAADTRGLTWSRPPSKIHFQGIQFEMPYSLSVPASGEAFLGFADSEGTFTSDVRKLAAAAVHDMVEPPTITSPHDGATVHGQATTVAGKVVAGANGLPTKVTVNGHKATLGATSLVHGAWSVRFTEPLGRHTLTVTAYDRVGNIASRSIIIRNA